APFISELDDSIGVSRTYFYVPRCRHFSHVGHRNYGNCRSVLPSGLRLSSTFDALVVLGSFLYLPCGSQRPGLVRRSIFYVWLELREYLAVAASHVCGGICLAHCCEEN